MTAVEDLKKLGRYFEAGALAFVYGAPAIYGCHYGMKSDLYESVRQFMAGYLEAEREAKSN